MKIATKGPLECVSNDRDTLHAQSRGMNKESAAAMWAIQQKKKKSNETCHDSELPLNQKILEIRGKVFPCKVLSFFSSRLKGIRPYDARAYSSFVLSVFFVFKLAPTRISSIVKKFIDKLWNASAIIGEFRILQAVDIEKYHLTLTTGKR